MPLYAPISRRKRILGVKVETTPGTAVTPAAADATTPAYDVDLQNDTEYERRTGNGIVPQFPGVPGGETGTLKFKTDIIGGASLPPWMSVILAGCNVVANLLVVTPQFNFPGQGGSKTLTFYTWQDGQLKCLYGAQGTGDLKFPSGKKCFVEWTFKGLYAAVAGDALPVPTYITTAPLKFENSGLLIGGTVTPRVSLLQLMIGNDVQLREDGTGTGYRNAYIADRQSVVKMDSESMLVANVDVDGWRRNRTEQAIAFGLGAAANGLAFACAKAQLTKNGEGNRNGIQTDDLEFDINDDWTLTSQ